MLIVPGGRQEAPRAPAEIAEAVELYAREHGRTGSIEFAVGPNVWIVKLSLRPNDKRMLLWREGRAPEPPVETVWLQERNPDEGKVMRFEGGRPVREGMWRPLDIYQMGAEGVRTFLERGNCWSGRGEYSSVADAVQKAAETDEREKVRFREQMKEENRYERRDNRRAYLGIPFTTVGIDLKQPEEKAS